jgi:hypothetical protein
MTFEEILNQAIALLQRQGRVSYRALKRQFDLDEAYVEDLKLELIEVHQVAVDQGNTMLVWIGAAAAPSPAADVALVRARAPDTAPLTYTPPHLTDKILAARPALAGERKQVTVLFADLKDSTELIRGLAHLQAAEFLYETRLFPEPEYTFKHALTHEVAYSSLLLERRRGLHGRLVQALEAQAPDRGAEQVDRLAHHALRGEVWDKAVTYCQQAGARAHDHAAFREAEAMARTLDDRGRLGWVLARMARACLQTLAGGVHSPV